MNERPRLAAATLAAMLASATATARDLEPSRGELLYENHCTGCHDSVVHVRADRRARDAAEVEARVRTWARTNRLGWTQEDVRQVTEFLVSRYYRFGSPPAGSAP